MSYLTVKALHFIGLICWFAGLFYMPRLLIYDVEANDRPETERSVLQAQLRLMARRLWYGITWPAMVATLVFGFYLLALYGDVGRPWVHAKLALVGLLVVYHLVTGRVRKQLVAGSCRWKPTQIRLWNEVATVLLVITVFVASRKEGALDPFLWVGVVGLVALLVLATFVYKRIRLGGEATIRS